MLAAGTLRDKVVFGQPLTVDDGAGGRTTTTTTIATAWARVDTTLSAEGLIGSQQVAAGLTHVVTTFYQRDLAVAAPTWTITWGSRVLQVQTVENVESRNAVLRFLCREVQS